MPWQGKLATAFKEAARRSIISSRTARLAGALERSVTDWLHSGVPSGVTIEDIEDDDPSELLKKGETITAAIERLSASDQHRVRSAPFPSGIVKQEMRVQVAALADAAADPIDLSAEALLAFEAFSGTR
jgi:hypothetical protein